MPKKKILTTDQKLDYLLEKAGKIDILVEKVGGMEKDIKYIKREVTSHTGLLEHIIGNAVTLEEHKALKDRVANLEQS